MSKFDFIVRKWYVASCLALGLLSGMALTACGDDDPAPTPEVPDTPDTPDEPEGSTTSTVTSYVIQYFYSNETMSCAGDSVSYFAFVDELVKAKQDSVTQVSGSLKIDHQASTRQINFYDTVPGNTSKESAKALILDLANSGEKPRGFVYSGIARIFSVNLEISQDGTVTSSGNSSGHASYPIYIPRLIGHHWATADAGVEIAKISFGKSKSCTINDDATATFSFVQSGYDVVLSLGNEEKCAFLLNEAGTEMRLVRLDGEAVENGPVYTRVEE